MTQEPPADPTPIPPAGSPAAPRIPPSVTDDERRAATPVLTAEYGLLMAALGAAWSASLARSSIFLGVVSAAGVALGFAAQGGADRATFIALALVVLPLVLFLGVATFVRLVQVQRESMVYITGMNRIRRFLADGAPASRPYLVLPVHDDALSLYRSVGTGMIRRPPRYRLPYLVAQTQGIVGVVTAVVAGAIAGLATAAVGTAVAWILAIAAFVITIGTLFAYWQRSLNELQASIRPLFPTPPDGIDTPF